MINEPNHHPHHDHDHDHERPSKLIIPLLILLLAIYFYFSPSYIRENPTLSLNAVQVPTFILSSSDSTVSLTFTFYAAVINPTRFIFSYSSTSAQLFYAGQQVGAMLIPGKRVYYGKEEFMVSIFVKSLPISVVGLGYIPDVHGIDKVKQTIELKLKTIIKGRLSIFWFYYHHVESYLNCRVAVTISDGSVLHVHC